MQYRQIQLNGFRNELELLKNQKIKEEGKSKPSLSTIELIEIKKMNCFLRMMHFLKFGKLFEDT